jgi:hypothetical protein
MLLPVRVRVENMRDRLVGDRAHLIEDALAVVGELGVDEQHAVVADEHGSVAALAGDAIEIHRDVVDPELPRLTENGHGHEPADDDRTENDWTLHGPPNCRYAMKPTRCANQ